MKRYLHKIIGLAMFISAIAFMIFALNHPEMSFPWPNIVTWAGYGIYATITIALLLAPIKKK